MFKHVDCCSGHETGRVFLDGSLGQFGRGHLNINPICKDDDRKNDVG
jgi:hypothetical protein